MSSLPKNFESAITLYASGIPMKEVCRRMKVNYSTLQSHLQKRGLSRSNKQNSRKYEVNHNFFDVIDTEAKAYWLGFIYADGFITRSGNAKYLGISLATKDREHLEAFSKSIESTYPIKEYTGNTSYGEVTYNRVLICSEKLFDSLVKQGSGQQKTLKLTFPSTDIVPEHLRHHFCRGYFDGDGSWAKSGDGWYSFKLCGTAEFLTGYCAAIGFPGRKMFQRHKNSKNNWYVSVGGKRQVGCISNLLYLDATVFLPRKFLRIRSSIQCV
jgi:hypothetical protein